MNYKLILQNHVEGIQAQAWTFQAPATVGRDPNCDVCIEHDSISRKHCQFSINVHEALVVKDLESMNGTYLDDRRVQNAVLMPGQIVQIGALLLQIEFSDDASAPPPKAKSAPKKGNTYATQPLETFRPVPLPPEKPWWKKLFG